MTDKLKIVIPLYPDVTHLDFTGPHQVLVRTPNAEVVAASMGGRDIEAEGLTFANLADLAAVDGCDVLCVPGGQGATQAMLDEAFVRELRRLGQGARYVTSVCTGSLLLAAAGFLTGRRAACHWAWRELLPAFGAIPDPARVVRDGNIFTGGGVTAGIDFALTLVAEIAGAETAQAIQLQIEYAPAPPFDSGSPDFAPPEILARVSQRNLAAAAQRRAAVEAAAARMPADGF